MTDYDLLGEAFSTDPYSILAQMRRNDPCWYDHRLGAYVLTRYGDVARVLQDEEFSARRVRQFTRGAPEHLRAKVDVYVEALERWLLFIDPPHHTHLRSKLQRAFAPALLPVIEVAVQDAIRVSIEKLETNLRIDAIGAYAYPVPTHVLARVFGIADSDIDLFKRWTTQIFTLIGAGVADDAAVEAGYRGVLELGDYVVSLLKQKRSRPAADMLSALAVHDGPEDEGISEADVVGLFMSMIVAGHETSTNLIGNALRATLLTPSVRARVAGPADLPEAAVDEFVRYDGPVKSMLRRAKRDVVIAGMDVPEGSFLFSMLISANRDPREFSTPDRLDFDRQGSSHLGFGVGMHRCVGAFMARAVVRKAVQAFLRHFPEANIDGECVWQNNTSFRGLTTLPVDMGRRASRPAHHADDTTQMTAPRAMADGNDIADLAASLLGALKPFNRLPEATRLMLGKQAVERHAVPGEIIVREGDIGEEFYLVVAGSLHVLGRGFDGSELVLDQLGPGKCFGEQALLAERPVPRSASVRATTRSQLLVLPRKALKDAGDADIALIASLRKTGDEQQVERNTLFRERILSTMGIAGDYSIERYSAGDYIFREGDRGEKIYLVTAGRALVLRGDGDQEKVLSELLPGQFFGELAILNDAPRAASVKAAVDLDVVALDGLWFRSLLARNPRLSSLMADLKAVYVMPARGLVTLQSSDLSSNPTLTALHHLADGRKVLSVRHTESQAFRGMVMDADEATSSVRFLDPTGGIHRQLHLFENRIVEIENEGAWPGLGVAFEYMLDGTRVTDKELTGFEVTGDLGSSTPALRDGAEILCRCSGVTTAALVSAISQGCRGLDQIAAATRATMVCGGCIPTVMELLGKDEWMAATCVGQKTLAVDIRIFRLCTTVPVQNALPGQHIVLQARIRGRWVSRPYTLVSNPAQEGAYEFIVRRETEGLLSPWLFDQLGDGGAMRISPPQGTFCIDAGHAGAVVFLAGGIGITPALAAARSLAARPGGWPLVIDYSVATTEEGVCRDELEGLAQKEPRLTLRFRVTRADGRIGPRDVVDYCARFPEASFWICGSDRYVTGVTALLEQCGLPADRIVVERFTAWG